jgi:hypothetical protein
MEINKKLVFKFATVALKIVSGPVTNSPESLKTPILLVKMIFLQYFSVRNNSLFQALPN